MPSTFFLLLFFYLQKARVKTIRHTTRRFSDAHIFLATVSDVQKGEAMECCKKYKLCPTANVISPASDNTAFYEAFYEILNKNLKKFSSDLETRTSTRHIHATKCELNSLIEKLHSKNVSEESPLTKQCLEIIEKCVYDDHLKYDLF